MLRHPNHIWLLLEIWRIWIQSTFYQLLLVLILRRVGGSLIMILHVNLLLLVLLLLEFLHQKLLLLLLEHQVMSIFSLSMLPPFLLHLLFRLRSCLCPCIFHFRFFLTEWQTVKCVVHRPLHRWLADLLHYWWPFNLSWRWLWLLNRFNFFFDDWRRWFLLGRFLFFRFLGHNFFDLLCIKVIGWGLTVRSRAISFIAHCHGYQFLVSMQLFLEFLRIKILVFNSVFILYYFRLSYGFLPLLAA